MSQAPKVKCRVVYPHCQQIGPVDWRVYPRVMDVTPETTVAEILAWHDMADPKDQVPSLTLVVERDV